MSLSYFVHHNRFLKSAFFLVSIKFKRFVCIYKKISAGERMCGVERWQFKLFMPFFFRSSKQHNSLSLFFFYSPSSLSYEDTYNTLKYAERAKKIEVKVCLNLPLP